MNRAMKLAACCGLACALIACGDDDDGAKPRPDAARDARADDAGASAAGHAGDDAGRAPADAATADASAPQPERPVCSADGFCWELPTPQGETLRAAWGSAPDDVWAVGDDGVILHYDGLRFSAPPPVTHADLFSVHGSAADDVWAVGKGGVALHYDGSAWNEMSDVAALVDASGGSMTAALYGVYAASKDAVWAVGYSGVAPVIIFYDGERFTSQALALMTDKPLRAVWGVSPEHVWAVGDGGVIRSFDGTAWKVESSPTGAALASVHALTDHDVWAVGAGGAAVHWDGTRWTAIATGINVALSTVRVDIDTVPPDPDAAMPMPMMMPPMPADAGLDASLPPPPEGPWRVWAFGADGRVLRYNGTVWAELPSGGTLALHGAARLGQGALLAVGEHGQISEFDGDALRSLSHGSHHNHLALWGDGDTLWSVGDEITRRDASGWSELERPSDRSLYAVWGDGRGLWAVGTEGTIVRYEADDMRVLDVPAAAGSWLRGVWGAGGSVWIVGNAGLALINAAGGFLAVDTKVRTNLLDVWGSADDAFWAVGEGGVVLRWDGISWLKVPTGPMGGVVQNLQAVWGSAADDVWVVGTESTILHWNGTRFEALSRAERYTLNDVWGRGPDDVYAVGTGGTALHYDGMDWTELETGTRSSLQSVFGDDHGRVFAAGVDGVVLVREP